MRFAAVQGFNSGDQFYTYLKDSFDALYAEGEAGKPKMLNVGLHCRLIGRPGRIMALRRFLDYIQSKPEVWGWHGGSTSPSIGWSITRFKRQDLMW